MRNPETIAAGMHQTHGPDALRVLRQHAEVYPADLYRDAVPQLERLIRDDLEAGWPAGVAMPDDAVAAILGALGAPWVQPRPARELGWTIKPGSVAVVCG
jgi:hypothetical protein